METPAERALKFISINPCLRHLAPIAIWLAIWASSARGIHGQDAPPSDLKSRIDVLVKQLDAEDYDDRRSAQTELDALTKSSTNANEAMNILREKFTDAELSFEQRVTIASLIETNRDNPRGEVASEIKADSTLEGLVEQLASSSYDARNAAESKLRILARQPREAMQLLGRMKVLASQPQAPASLRRTALAIYQHARETWLSTDQATWQLPEVNDSEMDRWIAVLAKPAAETNEPEERLRAEAAERELLDLLVQDRYTAKVAGKLRGALANPAIDFQAAQRLESVLQWTLPAMAAEFWQAGDDTKGPRLVNTGIQHLWVNIPNKPLGAMRASHFDRCDDLIAHCVSGNSLSPGEYRVGVFIPHPDAYGYGTERRDSMFHLVNLPTPHRRMHYEFVLRGDEHSRYVRISAETMARALREKRRLDATELRLIHHLDGPAVSRFAGPYLLQMTDQELPSGAPQQYNFPVASGHRALAVALFGIGTKDAAPGLMNAIREKRFLATTPNYPIGWEWMALLRIAQRDPWQDVDRDLISLVGSSESLAHPETSASELGATAAAILLERHGESPIEWGIEVVDEQPFDTLPLQPRRFLSAEARQRFLEKISSTIAKKSAENGTQSEPSKMP